MPSYIMYSENCQIVFNPKLVCSSCTDYVFYQVIFFVLLYPFKDNVIIDALHHIRSRLFRFSSSPNISVFSTFRLNKMYVAKFCLDFKWPWKPFGLTRSEQNNNLSLHNDVIVMTCYFHIYKYKLVQLYMQCYNYWWRTDIKHTQYKCSR